MPDQAVTMSAGDWVRLYEIVRDAPRSYRDEQAARIVNVLAAAAGQSDPGLVASDFERGLVQGEPAG